MKIMIKRIPEEGSQYEGDEPASVLELEKDSFCQAVGDLHYDLYAQYISGELVVRGTLAADFGLTCARCSEFFSTTVVDSDFLRAYSVSEEVDSVDITPDMREDLLLQVPPFPVCSKRCRGLCSLCGADLNRGSCSCGPEGRSDMWSALDNLKL